MTVENSAVAESEDEVLQAEQVAESDVGENEPKVWLAFPKCDNLGGK